MKITKISEIPYLSKIPIAHLKWCGVEVEERKEKVEDECLFDKRKESKENLVLYNQKGEVKVYEVS